MVFIVSSGKYGRSLEKKLIITLVSKATKTNHEVNCAHVCLFGSIKMYASSEF